MYQEKSSHQRIKLNCERFCKLSKRLSVNWLIKLNVQCKQLNVGPSTGSEYHIGNDTNKKNLQRVVEERDLGVTFTSNLKWATKCQNTAAKTMAVWGMIKRSYPVINKEMFLVLYSVYVRPHLEYCVQVWAPYF